MKRDELKCAVYIAASVDGFNAKPDGGINWLHNSEYAAVPTKGMSSEEFINNIEAIVMGRH